MSAICWICGKEANTGEHLLKASDIRSLFGEVSQKTPLFKHTDQKRNEPVNTIKSEKLKSAALICNACNSALTQPYDMAWQRMSEYLQNRKPKIAAEEEINLNEVFPGAVAASMLDLHLYFVKLLGCWIMEINLPLDIQEFSNSLLKRAPHPNVHLAIGPITDGTGVVAGGMTNLQVEMLGDKCAFTTCMYFVGAVTVNVMFALPGEKRQGLAQAWHPNTVKEVLRMAKFSG